MTGLPWRAFAVRVATLALVLIGLTVPTASAKAPNDDFQDALVITGWRGSANAEIDGATRQQGEPDHLPWGGGDQTVWFKWRAPADGRVQFDTWGSWTELESDYTGINNLTRLQIYQGGRLDRLQVVRGYEGDFRYPLWRDYCETSYWPGSSSSHDWACAMFMAEAGKVYRIVMDTDDRTSGTYELNWNPVSMNDDFDTPEVLKGWKGSTTGNTEGAIPQYGEWGHAGLSWSSVWYRWTAPASGVASFAVVPADGPFTITAYSGSDIHRLTYHGGDWYDWESAEEVSYTAECPRATGLKRCAMFRVQKGTVYRIVVDSGDFWGGNDYPRSALGFDLEWWRVPCDFIGTLGDDGFVSTFRDETFCGLAGNDTVSYEGAGKGVTVDLAASTALGHGTDRLLRIENVTGSSFNDVMDGDDGPNVLRGLRGNDALAGKHDTDLIDGGEGNDRIFVGGHEDEAVGGPGVDTLYLGGAGGPMRVDLGAGTAKGAWLVTIFGIENVVGSPFADTLIGSSAANVLEGRDGNDEIDVLDGNPGDRADGGAGTDTCIIDAGDVVVGCP